MFGLGVVPLGLRTPGDRCVVCGVVGKPPTPLRAGVPFIAPGYELFAIVGSWVEESRQLAVWKRLQYRAAWVLACLDVCLSYQTKHFGLPTRRARRGHRAESASNHNKAARVSQS